jgi:hypothetical protein
MPFNNLLRDEALLQLDVASAPSLTSYFHGHYAAELLKPEHFHGAPCAHFLGCVELSCVGLRRARLGWVGGTLNLG